MRAFLTRLSPDTVRARYASAWSSLAGPVLDSEMRRLLDRDTRRHVVLLAMDDAKVRGVGEFIVDDAERTAELGLVVEDAFQHRGIGRLLYRGLEDLARQRGIRAFVAEVQWQNYRVRALLQRTGRPLTVQPGYGGGTFTLRLDGGPGGDIS